MTIIFLEIEAGKKNPVKDHELSFPAVKHRRVTEVSLG
jgi:hypothetical protein